MRQSDRPTRATRRSWAAATLAMVSTRATLLAKQATATRFFILPTRSCRLSRTSASEPEWPSTRALVESQTMASTPSSPRRRKAASSVTSPTSGSGSSFQSPVWSTLPTGVRMAMAFGSGIECVRVISSRSNGGMLNLPDERHLGDRHLLGEPMLAQLLAQHRGGERRRIDRAAEPRPQIGHGAEMVFMGMGQHEADQFVAALLDDI